MYTKEALLDIHERVQRNQRDLLAHCRELTDEELNREIPGFGYGTVRLQIHHGIGAQRYWIGVIRGEMNADDDNEAYPTVDLLEALRAEVAAVTEEYLRGADELNTPRPMVTWGGREKTLTPAHVVLRTQMHLYHHQGQILAMCRILGKPGGGLDFPLV